MKILILVLSSEHHPYDLFMQAQKQTWDSQQHPDVDVVYYYCGGRGINKNILNQPQLNHSKELSVECPTDYKLMHWKLKLALDMLPEYRHYDFIFRTNASSYIDKDRLLDVAKSLPRERLYAGWRLGWTDRCVYFEGHRIKELCISGAGIWFTPDTLQILHKKLKKETRMEDDVLFGRILLSNNIRPLNMRYMVTVNSIDDYRAGSYHYRLKTHDRIRDIETMHLLHDKINGNEISTTSDHIQQT